MKQNVEVRGWWVKHRPLTLASVYVSLAIAAGSAQAGLATIETESGTLGTNFLVGNSSGTIYISNRNNNTANNPGIPGRIASYNVTFPEAGAYALYARIRVNVGGASDDSLFYGSGFGVKSPGLNSDWVQANNLYNVGYTTGDTNVVLGGGSAGSFVWKWINLSAFAPGPTFTVTAGNLSQTFQIGGREDGLDLDKLLFGTSTNTFTVAELDAGGPGTPLSPTATIGTTNVYQTIEGFGGAIAFCNGWITATAPRPSGRRAWAGSLRLEQVRG